MRLGKYLRLCMLALMPLDSHALISTCTILFSVCKIYIRHNFGMAHSGGLDGQTYTDHTGMMVS